MSALTVAPMTTVPRGSVNAVKSVFFRYRWNSPTTNAPGIPPGKAYTVPMPNMFLMIPVATAMEPAYHGPRMTPAIALIICCAGKHLVVPSGM